MSKPKEILESKFKHLIEYCKDKENFDQNTLKELIDDYMRLHKHVYPYLK
tara:strand:+ start:364 stop:513 length:150 start_codon:yes stop_codon:yes gene_type:complete